MTDVKPDVAVQLTLRVVDQVGAPLVVKYASTLAVAKAEFTAQLCRNDVGVDVCMRALCISLRCGGCGPPCA